MHVYAKPRALAREERHRELILRTCHTDRIACKCLSAHSGDQNAWKRVKIRLLRRLALEVVPLAFSVGSRRENSTHDACWYGKVGSERPPTG
jgi:hypothetical protein